MDFVETPEWRTLFDRACALRDTLRTYADHMTVSGSDAWVRLNKEANGIENMLNRVSRELHKA